MLADHRRLGMHMAGVMFKVLVAAVLARIPDDAVDHAATRFYAGNPELNGVVTMPATCTPDPASRALPAGITGMALLKDVLGADRPLFGSDFPHTEGLPEPTGFVKDIPTFSPEESCRIMRDSVLDLLAVTPPRG